jgi:hypothetical protein
LILLAQKTAVRWASGGDGRGQAMKGGHFFPEENPYETAVQVKQFISAFSS